MPTVEITISATSVKSNIKNSIPKHPAEMLGVDYLYKTQKRRSALLLLYIVKIICSFSSSFPLLS